MKDTVFSVYAKNLLASTLLCGVMILGYLYVIGGRYFHEMRVHSEPGTFNSFLEDPTVILIAWILVCLGSAIYVSVYEVRGMKRGEQASEVK